MARRTKSDNGEQLTVRRTMRLTPSQAAELDANATERGVRVSMAARDKLFRRSAARPAGSVITPTQIAAVKRELDASQRANNSAGVLLNQLARHANTTGELGPERLAELDEAIALTQRATQLYIAALSHVLSL
jgi:hypothetical protein